MPTAHPIATTMDSHNNLPRVPEFDDIPPPWKLFGRLASGVVQDN